MEKRDKVYWHDAFLEAMQLELNDYLHMLEFESEYHLSKEALVMDLLIIKKRTDQAIEKNIGKIFKGHNIVEFKSERDSLAWQDYNKVMAYALLYSAFNNVHLQDITVTFAVTMHPKAVLKYLETQRNLTVHQPQPGVYYVQNDICTVQILESKSLSTAENLFLHSMRSNLTQADLTTIAGAYRNIKAFEVRNVYLDRILQANEGIVKEMINMDLAQRVYEMTSDSPVWRDIMRREAKGLATELAQDMAQDIAYDMARDIAPSMAQDMAQGMAQDIAQGMAQDIAQDMAQGIAQGMAVDIALQKVKTFAKKMLSRGVAPQDISADLDMALEDVLALQA